MKAIHRANLAGNAACGALPPFKLSATGAVVTCDTCRATEVPDLAAQHASIKEAAERFRAGRS